MNIINKSIPLQATCRKQNNTTNTNKQTQTNASKEMIYQCITSFTPACQQSNTMHTYTYTYTYTHTYTYVRAIRLGIPILKSKIHQQRGCNNSNDMRI